MTMKIIIVKKLVFGLVALGAIVGLMAVSGCDPDGIGQKIGGGGLLQNYTLSNGRYCN
jgi:hypothetical protein